MCERLIVKSRISNPAGHIIFDLIIEFYDSPDHVWAERLCKKDLQRLKLIQNLTFLAIDIIPGITLFLY